MTTRTPRNSVFLGLAGVFLVLGRACAREVAGLFLRRLGLGPSFCVPAFRALGLLVRLADCCFQVRKLLSLCPRLTGHLELGLGRRRTGVTPGGFVCRTPTDLVTGGGGGI